MQTITLPSPAKINLFLHIVGRRVDDYHELQTAFQFLDFCDELTFTLREDNEVRLHSNTCAIPVVANLVTRAALLLQKKSGTTQGVDIFLSKKIPLGAGLGGGSSNCATTLLGLNFLWQTGFSESQLHHLGLQLGADVPVFLYGKSAWAEGIGDHLQPFAFPESPYLLIIPPCEVSTAKIFSDPELTRNTPMITIDEFLKQGGHNDCEPITRKHYPLVNQALDWLTQFTPARMSGTGCCVYGLLEKNTAQVLRKNLPLSFCGVVAKSLNCSPLHKSIEKFAGYSKN